MYISFLVEDLSGEKFLHAFLGKYNNETPEKQIKYNIYPYKGIGGFVKGANINNIKSQQLLCDLPKRLKALSVALSTISDSSVFIVLDNDSRNTGVFREQLESIVTQHNITIDCVFCIAIEEMEAWLLGDREALKAAYPSVADRITTKLPNYQQDSICGTWEVLADILTNGGMKKFKKMNPSAHDVGCRKSEWAENVGKHLNIRDNLSPSFQYMVSELDKRRDTIA